MSSPSGWRWPLQWDQERPVGVVGLIALIQCHQLCEPVPPYRSFLCDCCGFHENGITVSGTFNYTNLRSCRGSPPKENRCCSATNPVAAQYTPMENILHTHGGANFNVNQPIGISVFLIRLLTSKISSKFSILLLCFCIVSLEKAKTLSQLC